MVQLAENTAPPPRGPVPQHSGFPHPPSSMTQPQQLTADITAAAQLGRPPLAPSAVTPQLASNGSQKTHSRPPSGLPDAKNGYIDPPQRGARGPASRREQEAGSRKDASQGHVRLRKDVPDGLYAQDRWSYYGDPRVRMDQTFLRDERYRRWSRDGEGAGWPSRERRTPVDSRSVAFEAEGGKEDGKSEAGEGGDRGESRRRPPLPPHQDTPRSSHTLPRHNRDRDRDQERERIRDGGERDRDRDRNRDRDRDRNRERERDRNRERDPERENEPERDRERDRDRDRDRERDRNRERDRHQERDHRREPRRREPVGEETGYDSDHSRMSRATAASYSSRSLPRRPRADSVASHASHASHARTPARPRGYEEMYEQYPHYYQYNPMLYYKDYYQWVKQCRQAYQSESFYDDRTSIHSGRSSVNNEPEKSVSSPRPAYDPYGYFYGPPSQPPLHSSQFLQDFHGTSALGHFEPSPIYPDGSLSQLKSYPSGELSGVPSVADDAVSEAAQRMTPLHFGRPHICAKFTPTGQMVLVLPKDPRDGEKAVVQLRDVQKMLCVDPAETRAIMQMKNYPGPLTLSDTHKDVVMRHCEHKAAEAAKSLTLPDKESVTLIWEYLALLVKQNGKLFGSDIAGLLLKGREVGPPATHPATHTEEPPEDEPTDNSPQDEGIDLPSQPPAPPPARDETALLKKFTEYLCLGRKKEAVDYAIQEGLWGHALVLAYKMDSTTHARVLAAFISHIPHTDVVLTLLQQLSGKKPEITKNYSPEQWGDWRQHLAVMVSNPTGATHKDRASIVLLGDALAARGQLHAAHFCYLVAGMEWGSYACKDSKLVLIGASNNLPFQAFATVEAIQCTEVYEFARSLDANNSPSLDTFQSYKLVYALRLTECGFPAEALRYCEVISQAVEKNPTTYKVEFLSQVYELACRLKYHDLHYQMYQGEVSEIPDPQWLSNVRDVLDAARQREHQQMMEHQDTGTQDTHSYMYQQDQGTESLNQTIAADPSYSVADTTQNHVPHVDPHSMSYSVPGGQSYQQVDPAYTSQASPDVLDSSHYTSSPHSPSKAPEAASMNPGHPHGGMAPPQEEGPSAVETPMMSQPSPEHSHYPQDTTGYQASYQQHEPYLQPSSQTPNGYDQGSGGGEQQQQQQQQQQSMSTTTTLSQPSSQGGYPGYQQQQQQQQPYQPWGQPQPTEGGGAPPQPDALPSRSPEPSAPQAHRTPEEEAYWAEMSNKKEDEEEYDEFGGDVYEYEEDYEEEEVYEDEALVMVDGAHRQPAANFQLRHRHRSAPVDVSSSPTPDTNTTATTTPAASRSDTLASVEIMQPNTSTTPLSSPPPLLSLPPPAPLLLQPPPTQPPPPPPATLVGGAFHPSSPPNCLAPQSGGASSNSNKEPSLKETKAEEDKMSAGKESKGANAKGGWFSSLLGWKSSTPQAVLPDDKNPKIVWDKDKKTWINTDGSEETTTAVGPPPKLPPAIRTPPPSVARSGNRMSRYVDPMKDKAGGTAGGTQPAPMLPLMPMPSVSPSLMMPQPMQPSQDSAEASNNPSQPQPQPPLQPQPLQQPSVPAPAPAPAPEMAQLSVPSFVFNEDEDDEEYEDCSGAESFIGDVE